MNVDKIKKVILTNPLLKAFLFLILIIGLVFYFKQFFTVGINYDDTFLNKEVKDTESIYMGESVHGEIHITVQGIKNKDASADVIYKLPNNINKQYTVTFKDSLNWNLGINDIRDKDGNIIFEGNYRKDSIFLYDKDGMPFIDSNIQMLINGETPYNADYKVPLKNVVDLAYYSQDTIQGKLEYLFLAVLLFAVTLIDIKFPLFFFTLGHFIDVRDPEPSDFYIFMQKISWFVYPIIGVILMMVAIK